MIKRPFDSWPGSPLPNRENQRLPLVERVNLSILDELEKLDRERLQGHDPEDALSHLSVVAEAAQLKGLSEIVLLTSLNENQRRPINLYDPSLSDRIEVDIEASSPELFSTHRLDIQQSIAQGVFRGTAKLLYYLTPDGENPDTHFSAYRRGMIDMIQKQNKYLIWTLEDGSESISRPTVLPNIELVDSYPHPHPNCPPVRTFYRKGSYSRSITIPASSQQ